MRVEKLSISLAPDLGENVRAAAEEAGVSVSAWLAGAAAAQLRRKALGDFLRRWQAKHGKITDVELARARSELGYATRKGRR
jgi:hypothetical protein